MEHVSNDEVLRQINETQTAPQDSVKEVETIWSCLMSPFTASGYNVWEDARSSTTRRTKSGMAG